MSQSSKYSSDQFSKAVSAINIALDAQQAPTDLALMALGESIIERVRNTYDKDSQAKVIEQFCNVLKQSL